MSRKALQGVKSGFNKLSDQKWYPVSVVEAKTQFGKPGSSSANVLRLNLAYSVAEEINGAEPGDKQFDGGALEGKLAGITRERLEQIRPDIDWGDFDFPEPSEDQSELEEALVGQEGFIFIKHTKDKTDASRTYVNVAKFQQDEPADLYGDADDEEDDEDDDES